MAVRPIAVGKQTGQKIVASVALLALAVGLAALIFFAMPLNLALVNDALSLGGQPFKWTVLAVAILTALIFTAVGIRILWKEIEALDDHSKD